GLFYTSNISAASPVFSAVTAYPFQEPLRVFFNPYNTNDVWVTSFGNGLEMGSTVPLGLNEVTNQNTSIVVFPNPSIGKFTFSLSHPELGSGSHTAVEIYNMLGEKVYSKSLSVVNSQLSIDMGSKPAGIYMYRLTNESGALIGNGKLLIQ
ncbi:MAG TPA: T9SS type A sorting domain-containing protein, partial [Bacteroidia bacterium]|nr:T9SS type A sorting domain-containing protein [Bacteroidia bacterium]